MRFRHLLLALPSLALACSSAGAADPGAPAVAAQEPAATPHGFHFFAERDGAKVEVDKIVFDEATSARLEGLAPHAAVTIKATAYAPGETGKGYVASADFVADEAGVVDTAVTPAVKGTYTGTEPDGLVWSGAYGKVAEGKGPDRTAVYFEAFVDDASVAEGHYGRLWKPDSVTVQKVTDDGLVAEYFLPAGATDSVPILAFGGSEGGIYGGEYYAARLSSLGHPILAVAYFGAAGVPDDLVEVPLEYFGKAFAWLDKRPETRKGRAIVIGGSRGGELSLQLAATFPNVVGAIAETPSSYRWPALSGDGKSAWTYQGKPLAFVPQADPDTLPPTMTGPDGSPAYVLRSGFERDLAAATPATLEAARIHLEGAAGSVLMLAGDDDKMWPACDFTKRAMDKLSASGHVQKLGDEAVCFPSAGHDVGSVGLSTAGSMWASLQGTSYALGGTAAGNAHAGRAGQAKIREFIARVAK